MTMPVVGQVPWKVTVPATAPVVGIAGSSSSHAAKIEAAAATANATAYECKSRFMVPILMLGFVGRPDAGKHIATRVTIV
jgi:hypothetical protein